MMTNSAAKRENSTVLLDRSEPDIAILRLGDESEKPVLLTKEKLDILKDHLITLKKDPPRGLIITGSSAEMFSVGVDLNILAKLDDRAKAEELAREGQEIFERLASLPYPTIAAISGPCVGGACELALACNYRLITNRENSVIGLPEVRLGIIPGFGGTQRLPRLIGLPKALELLLSGRILKPQAALRIGLVDEVVTFESLEKRALDIVRGQIKVQRNNPGLIDRLVTSLAWGRKLICWLAARKLRKVLPDQYPAPFSILATVYYGYREGLAKGLLFEAKELSRLAVSEEVKALVNLFFLQDASKKIGKSAKSFNSSWNALVIGGNDTGSAIAGLLATKGFPVVLQELDPEILKKSLAAIKKQLSAMKYLSAQEESFILNRIETETSGGSYSSRINFVLDTIPERSSEELVSMAKELPPELVIAVNPALKPISEIASPIPSPERVIGMRFAKPTAKVPFVEIIPGRETSAKAISVAAAFAARLGRFPVVVQDVPGFLVTRLTFALYSEAEQLLSDGYYPGYVDQAMQSFGMQTGPFSQMDQIGLETVSGTFQFLRSRCDNRFSGPLYCKRLSQKGREGKSVGRGFYDYSDGKEFRYSGLRVDLGIEKAKENVEEDELVQDRMFLSLLLEALDCLQGGVAGTPGKDAARQIDLASVYGAGFPACYGGVLFHAGRQGLDLIAAKLGEFEKRFGIRFAVPEMLKKQINEKTFY